MVALELKPSLELASCCKVEVVNGAAGLRVPGVLVMFETVNFVPLKLPKKASASFSVANFHFPKEFFDSSNQTLDLMHAYESVPNMPYFQIGYMDGP